MTGARTYPKTREGLIYSELPVAHGCAAIFHDCKSLKMKESENRIFRFLCSEKSRMDLFRAFLSKPKRLTAPLGVPVARTFRR